MPSFPDIDPPLTAPGVALRLAAERDIPEILIAHQDDPGLHVVLGLPRPPSGAELGRRIEGEAVDRAAGVGAWLTILRPSETDPDVCRGQVYVHDIDPDHRRAELGIWVAPSQRGRGLATAALAVAGRWLLTECGMMRVELLTEPDNETLVRAATSAGFVAEGVLRGYLRALEGRVDVRVLSLIPDDLAAS